MSYYKYWKCSSYGLYGSNAEYDFQELKKYFEIDGSDVAYCKKDILDYKADNYYSINAGSTLYGKEYGFVIVLDEIDNDNNKYVATAISESYIWQGFGITEEKAKEALVNQWNEFLGENQTVEEFASEFNIEVAIWIDGNGYMMEL